MITIHNECESIYRSARDHTHLTREKAAELLNIAPGTLYGYEQNGVRPPDDIVAKMCSLYRDKSLAYKHIKSTVLGEFLPDIVQNNLQGCALVVIKNLNEVMQDVSNIIAIVSDGTINANERDTWEAALKKFNDLSGSLIQMMYYE